jgi:hypothetical protein
MFPARTYDPETVGLLKRVFDEAWRDILGIIVAPPLDPDAMRSVLAKRIMAAVNSGERDPKRLKLIAIDAIDA